MKKELFRKSLVLGTIILLLGILVGSAVSAIKIENEQIIIPIAEKDDTLEILNGYTNIDVGEAWDFLTDTANGIQIPIDVRTNSEWKDEHIDTSIPENPRHYSLSLLQDETLLQKFMVLYDSIEIILYCKSGGRSAQAAGILVGNEFNGTIYNMLGGITAWNAAGHPTISGGFLDIAVEEAWEFLNDTANGIQIPIDVRTYEEWIEERIGTLPPENASHHPLSDLQDPEKLPEFMASYSGNEIIFYCKSGVRSLQAAGILVDNEFTGTIYNMLGGIDAWKVAGYPTAPKPAICCIGDLTWTDVEPSAEVTGQFEVCNCGDEGSLLNWEFESAPPWGGLWEIEPDSGHDLAKDDCVTITATCDAPDEHGTEFTGKIKMINTDDPSDYCEIDVVLTTPRNKMTTNSLFLQFLQQFPNAFPVLRLLLGLQ